MRTEFRFDSFSLQHVAGDASPAIVLPGLRFDSRDAPVDGVDPPTTPQAIIVEVGATTRPQCPGWLHRGTLHLELPRAGFSHLVELLRARRGVTFEVDVDEDQNVQTLRADGALVATHRGCDVDAVTQDAGGSQKILLPP